MPLAIVLGVAHTSAQSAQTQVPTFEVASIKPNKSGFGSPQRVDMQSDRVSIVNVTLRTLIRVAYGIDEIVGGPSWIGSDRSPDGERFDVNAKAEAPTSREQLQAMLRTLLADRFMLRAHTETMSESVYALVLASRAGNLGPSIRRAEADCRTLVARAAAAGQDPNDPKQEPCGVLSAANALVTGRLSVRGYRLDQLAAILSSDVRRKVVDGTELNGTFDIDLTWTPQVFLGVPRNQIKVRTDVDPEGPSIFTALPEQLGLKLESTPAAAEVLVIDAIERPTPD
jgi:uncharacterized protein (TIGR03435 family)